MAAEQKNRANEITHAERESFSADDATTDHRDATRENAGDRDSSHLAERTAVAILNASFEAQCHAVRSAQFWHRAWRTALVVSLVGTVCAIGTYGIAGAWALIWPAAFDALRRQCVRDIVDAFRERAIAADHLHKGEVALARAIKASGVFRRGEK